jgi:hypothetical protein
MPQDPPPLPPTPHPPSFPIPQSCALTARGGRSADIRRCPSSHHGVNIKLTCLTGYSLATWSACACTCVSCQQPALPVGAVGAQGHVAGRCGWEEVTGRHDCSTAQQGAAQQGWKVSAGLSSFSRLQLGGCNWKAQLHSTAQHSTQGRAGAAVVGRVYHSQAAGKTGFTHLHQAGNTVNDLCCSTCSLLNKVMPLIITRTQVGPSSTWLQAVYLSIDTLQPVAHTRVLQHTHRTPQLPEHPAVLSQSFVGTAGSCHLTNKIPGRTVMQ